MDVNTLGAFVYIGAIVFLILVYVASAAWRSVNDPWNTEYARERLQLKEKHREAKHKRKMELLQAKKEANRVYYKEE